MRHEHVDPIHLEIKRATPGERRRKSLRRGIDRWHVDTCARARGVRRVALVTLTVRDDDPMAARGAIRGFWQAYRKRYGKRHYFSWAELQKRGAIHYHALIVDPPWKLERHARRWLKAHWPLGDLTPAYELRDWGWFKRSGGRYVKEYAKAKWRPRPRGVAGELPGGAIAGDAPLAGLPIDERGGDRHERAAASARGPDKSYQQDYDQLPPEIRTWECSRLSVPVGVLEGHVDTPEVVYTGPAFAPFPVRVLHYWLVGRWQHRPTRDRMCNLPEIQKRPGQLATRALHTEDSGATNTEASPVGAIRPVESNSPEAWGPAEQAFTPPLPFL